MSSNIFSVDFFEQSTTEQKQYFCQKNKDGKMEEESR